MCYTYHALPINLTERKVKVFQITITYPTVEDAILALSALRAYEAGAGTAKPVRQSKATAVGTKPTAEAEKAAALEKKAEPSAESEKTKPAGDAKTLDYDVDVAPKLSEAVKTNRAAAVDTLTKYDAKTGKQLKPEQYAGFLADLAAALAGGEEDLA